MDTLDYCVMVHVYILTTGAMLTRLNTLVEASPVMTEYCVVTILTGALLTVTMPVMAQYIVMVLGAVVNTNTVTTHHILGINIVM